MLSAKKQEFAVCLLIIASLVIILIASRANEVKRFLLSTASFRSGQEDACRGGDKGGTPDTRPFSGRHRSLRSLVPAPTGRPLHSMGTSNQGLLSLL